MVDKKEPLGLSRGSVRALLALLLVGGFLAAAFVGVPGESMTALAGLAGAVVTHYFNSRNQSGGT